MFADQLTNNKYLFSVINREQVLVVKQGEKVLREKSGSLLAGAGKIAFIASHLNHMVDEGTNDGGNVRGCERSRRRSTNALKTFFAILSRHTYSC